jgi:peroxiredoxin
VDKIHCGNIISKTTLVTVESEPVQIPDAKHLVHLQFRRFAGCPFCSMHLRSIVRRHDEIAAAGIREVVAFRSTAAMLRRHHADLPFAIVPDPQGELYDEYGVASALGAVFNPRVLLAAVPAVMGMLPKLPAFPPKGEGLLGLPAEFLIATDGRVIASQYGAHADDQWSVDELLSLAKSRSLS